METQDTQLVYGPFISRAQAKAQGLKYYFTGKPCKHGHISIRYVRGQCVGCSLARESLLLTESQKARKRFNYRKRRKDPDYLAKESAANAARLRRYRKENRVKHNDSQRRRKLARCQEDLHYALYNTLRKRVLSAIRANSGDKAFRTMELIGCTVAQLRAHLQAQFWPGMSWDNRGEWHIDHIRPCASFDLTDPAQQRECFHYTNLQPLWAADNLAKGDTWEPSAA